MITAFLQIFGKILLWIYEFCHSYALSLILFTLLTKLVLFPISYRGKKSMMQMNSLQGEIQKLQKQYGKDQARLSQETQALYEREGVNPMGGCLWSLLPLPILMGLYYIIRRPMLYMMCLTEAEITSAIEAVEKLGYSLGNQQLYKELILSSLLSSDSTVRTTVETALGDSASKLVDINFHWLGIDLSQIPTWKIWTVELNWNNIGLFLIPIVVVVVSLLYTQLSQRTNKMTMGQKDDKGNEVMNQTNQTMMIMMPLMYLWFGYIMPASMCVYMIFNSVFMGLQEVVCAVLLRGKFAEMQAERERRAAEEKEKEAQRKQEIAARRAEEAAKNRTKNGKKVKKSGQAKSKDRPTEHTRVGVRAYARGRAYDPERYPVTPYRDPQDVLDEAALEAALAKKHKGTPVEEVEELPEVIAPAVEETAAAEAPVTEAPVAEAPQSADEMFAQINSELTEESETKED